MACCWESGHSQEVDLLTFIYLLLSLPPSGAPRGPAPVCYWAEGRKGFLRRVPESLLVLKGEMRSNSVKSRHTDRVGTEFLTKSQNVRLREQQPSKLEVTLYLFTCETDFSQEALWYVTHRLKTSSKFLALVPYLIITRVTTSGLCLDPIEVVSGEPWGDCSPRTQGASCHSLLGAWVHLNNIPTKWASVYLYS